MQNSIGRRYASAVAIKIRSKVEPGEIKLIIVKPNPSSSQFYGLWDSGWSVGENGIGHYNHKYYNRTNQTVASRDMEWQEHNQRLKMQLKEDSMVHTS